MGSLIGHIVPGTAFGLIALWWTLDIFMRYFHSYFRDKPLIVHPISERYQAFYDNAKGKKEKLLFLYILTIDCYFEMDNAKCQVDI